MASPGTLDRSAPVSILTGTESSNPSLSSGESVGQEPRLSARVCAAGLASGSAETRRARRCRANRRQYLCRAIFQYRNAADGVGENATLVPTKSEPSPGLTVRQIF